ncbi:MAG: arsenite/tail-anchored protein-transporting ATPase [Actinomycetota bacterium]|jgi:arsenite-transporting ATPase|nr:arsenite/tail-anchored protein-transporting ATPase [Actinomycetota bacterium]
MYQFLTDPPRFLFFTGKGGVGKTSIACATAVHLADQGQRVLLVSTDPASNVGQVFGCTIGNTITGIPGVPRLSALEIDPEEAAEAYRERIVGPVRGLLPEREIASITEQLSGSCTTEVASFDEFTALLTDDALVADYDHVVFDTAPTGHTIRLLQLPGNWSDFLEAGKGDASCLGPLAGLDKQRSAYAGAVAALQDTERTRLVLVARAQAGAIDEIARTKAELDLIGIRSGSVVINAVLPETAGDDPLAAALRRREQATLESLPPALDSLPVDVISLKPVNVMGLPALRALLIPERAAGALHLTASLDVVDRPLKDLVDEIEAGESGLVMCMGKGGVGKTTIASSIAIALAERGHPVHLTTTDPAAHLEQTLDGAVDNLRVTRIDPVQATQEYRDHVIATKGEHLDEAGRANLAEDLLSPCTEEVAVFRQFSAVIREGRKGFVIVDTAPTGHTLLLLDAAGSYHRDMVRQMGTTEGFRTPMMMLQDAAVTKVILVTLPEQTPVLEASILQADLERAGIHPWAWVVNSSVAAARPTSAFLQMRAASEAGPIADVQRIAERLALVPIQVLEPVGAARLSALAQGSSAPVPV